MLRKIGESFSDRAAVTLDYADEQLPSAAPCSRAQVWFTLVLMLLFALSALLCIRAMRWDRWAHYEDTHRPWFDSGGGESYSSFKAWRAWRACWDRGLAAAVISAAAIIAALVFVIANRRHGPSRKWLLFVLLPHAAVIVYFLMRWGPDFRHPFPTWTG